LTIQTARARLDEPPVFGLIGNTPLVEVSRLNPHRERGVRVFAKLEGRNPGGSVKDRPALFMVRRGLATGALAPGKVLVDATSGNTGIAYAMLCAALGVPCRLFMPANASPERQRILRAYGAELVLTDPLEGQDGAIDAVREEVAAHPERYFYPDQYGNDANPLAHYETTGPEIWEQTRGAVTHFVAGLGTSGTAMGVTRYLKERNAAVRCIGLEPAGPFHGLEGWKHMATSHVPGIFHPETLDERRGVETERAYDLTRRLAREEGLFVGLSSGAALAGALDVAVTAPPGSVIVTLFPDGGEKYVSHTLWSATP